MNDRTYNFWVNWLVIASAIFTLQGISWIVIGSFDPFGYYDRMMSIALLDGIPLSQEARKVFQFSLVMLGATTAGFFVMFGFVARYGLLNRQRWAHWTLSGGLGTWFVLDSAASIAVGATFNVLLVNLPCLAVLGIPLLILYNSTTCGMSFDHRMDEPSDAPKSSVDREFES